MTLNTRALKKMQTLPDSPEFILGIEGKDVPVKAGVTAIKETLGVTALETAVTALPPTPTTTIVNISSAQILAMGTTPIELLPAPGAGMYYDIEKILIEYSGNLSAYTTTAEFIIINHWDYISAFSPTNLSTDDSVLIAKSFNVFNGVNYNYAPKLPLNSNLTLTTDSGDDLTLGDGTLRAIITYTVRTLGA